MQAWNDGSSQSGGVNFSHSTDCDTAFLNVSPGHVPRDSRDALGLFPNDAAVIRLVGALMLEQNDEWAISRRQMTLETLGSVSDENGRIIRWDPRLGSPRQINVFNREERDLAQGDRIQWRLVNKDLHLKNAERGTVEKLDGPIATIRWDRDDRVQTIDLSVHKTWDHGYAETVYSARSKTYDASMCWRW